MSQLLRLMFGDIVYNLILSAGPPFNFPGSCTTLANQLEGLR